MRIAPARSLVILLALMGACDDADPTLDPTDALPADALLDQSLPDAQADMALVDVGVDAGVDAASDLGPDQAVDMQIVGQCGAANPVDALTLEPGVAIEGEVCRDQSAWFALDVPAGFEASVALTFEHRLGDLELSVFDALGADPVAESATAADVERVSLPAVETPRQLRIEVYGYRRAVGQFALEATLFDTANTEETRVSGTAQYTDKAFDNEGFTGDTPLKPARHTRIEAVRVVDGAVVAHTFTDDLGAFALEFGAQPGDHIVRAVSVGLVGEQAVEVRDVDANLRYAVAAPAFAGGSEFDGIQLIAPVDAAIGGALNIIDVAVGAFAFFAPYVDGTAPTLTYRWQPGVAHGCGSCYADNAVRLAGAIEDTDEYDDVIILHELWHWFMAHFSADSSPGGSHRDRVVSPALAFGEGVAYAFAGLVRGAPDVVDTFIDATRHIDMEAMTINGETLAELRGTADGTPRGGHREELVEGLIWDSIDGPTLSERFDTVELGIEGGFTLLRRLGTGDFIDIGAPGIDVSDWLGMAACTADVAATVALADERAYPFEAADAPCEKGHVAPPLAIKVHAGRVILHSKTDLALRVRRGRPGAWKRHPIVCSDVCDLGPADPTIAVVVSAPNQAWAGVSWLGSALRQSLVGPRVHDVRQF